MDLDLDLGLVRSFVVTAEELHFRRAAERLFVTQQALSQRIRRLESLMGVPLFARGRRGVELTEEGGRFLAPAARLLTEAASAVESVRPKGHRPLRVDVVDGRLAPLRLVRALMEEAPGLPVNLSMRQALTAALPALLRGEIDAAFGRVHDVAGWPSEVAHRLVRLEPIRALVPRGHPLAHRQRVRMAELRGTGIWMPHYGQSSEWESYARRAAEEFGMSLTLSGPARDEEHFVQRLWEHRDMACLGGADVSYDYSSDIRSLRLVDPTPVYPWSMAWRHQAGHPMAARLMTLARGSAGGSLAFTLAENWLPEPDRALLNDPGVGRS